MPRLSGLNSLSLDIVISEAMSQSAFLTLFSFFFFSFFFHFVFCLDHASLPIKHYANAEYLTFMRVRYLLGS